MFNRLHIPPVRRCAKATILAALLAMALSTPGAAESFDKRLAAANALLHSGNYEGALSAYRDLQVEDPESDLLYYNMGCAQYEKAQGLAGAEFMDEAVQAYAAASEAFEKASWGDSPALRRNAQYNLANTAAQMAKLSVTSGNETEARRAFEECIRKYEELLARFPDDKAAQNNLDHMRYYLKKMLQKPPPQEDQQQQDQDQQEGQNEQQDEQQQQESQDEKQEQDQQRQNKQSQDQQDSQEQEEQQQVSSEQQEQQQSPQDQAESTDEESEPQDRQTIEAILQSLEDLDQREQYDLREGEVDSHLRKEWW
jgi:hypothetical protein